MGMLLTRVSFPGATPGLEQLERKLAEVTQMHVHIEVIAKDELSNALEATKNPRPDHLYIHFRSPADDFKHSIWCGWWKDCEFHIHEPVDALNRYPNYHLYALVAALVDLGGISQSNNELPDYARVTFNEWKRLNRGIHPPKWKTAAAAIGALAYFCWFTVAMFVVLFVYLLLAPFCWLKVRKQFREFKRRKGLIE